MIIVVFKICNEIIFLKKLSFQT